MQIKFIPFVLLAFTLSACGGNTAEPQVASANTPAGDTASGTSSNTGGEAAVAPVNTDAPALAVIENSQVRCKLHALTELKPAANALGKPEAGKQYYKADVSVEYLQGHNTSPAEYLLTSYIIDDKGAKYGLPMGSVKIALFLSDEEARQAEAAGALFNTSNPARGARFRDAHYGVEMPEGRRPVAWTMMLDGKEVKMPLQQ